MQTTAVQHQIGLRFVHQIAHLINTNVNLVYDCRQIARYTLDLTYTFMFACNVMDVLFLDTHACRMVTSTSFQKDAIVTPLNVHGLSIQQVR